MRRQYKLEEGKGVKKQLNTYILCLRCVCVRAHACVGVQKLQVDGEKHCVTV